MPPALQPGVLGWSEALPLQVGTPGSLPYIQLHAPSCDPREQISFSGPEHTAFSEHLVLQFERRVD